MSESSQAGASGVPPEADASRAAEDLSAAYARLREQMGRIIVGQDEVIEQLAVALFAGGHCILEGVPGLAKTLIISTLARCLSLTFRRIQFTPDLMPSDITGTEVMQEDRATGARSFRFLPGPIFANVLLADEINRTPPKTQAALLEAMQEKQVTVGGVRHPLEPPFFVLATQNPIEQEGTYPLPEAQQDRFMFKVLVGYPSYEQEFAIGQMSVSPDEVSIDPVLTREQILGFQRIVRQVPIAPYVMHYAVHLIRRTRPADPEAPERIREMVRWGAGPRALQFLVQAARARALLSGRAHVAVEDIQAVAPPVLRHRVMPNFAAEAEGYTPDRLIEELMAQTSPEEFSAAHDQRIQSVLAPGRS